MLRKLPLAMAIALAIAPFQAHAIGLGKITARSALNEPFDGEIQLLSVPQGELDGVKVSLAPPEVFKRAGIDRPFTLSYLKFKTFRKPNGEAIIEVFSKQLIREPYLNFLVEIDWPKGRMVREFTVLLDPPLTTGRKSSRVSTPTATSSQVSSPASTTTTARTTPARGTLSDSGEYGPVQNNETLWNIANTHKPGSVSVNQMMLAILDENPEAFSNYNINTLKAGSILRMPSEEQAKSLTRQQANDIANRQYQDWKDGNMSAAKPAPAAIETTAETQEDMPKALDSGMQSDDSAVLRLSGSDVALGSEGEGDAEEVKQQLIAAQENLVTSQSEADEMRSQMEVMQAQLADMKRLLELKDEQLAKLQAANDTDVMVDVPAEEALVEDTQVDEAPMDETPVDEAAVDVVGAEGTPEETAEEQSTEAESMAEPVSEPVSEPVEAESAQAEPPVEVAPAAVAEPEPEAKPAPAKEPGIVEMITGSATMMGIAVAVLVVLLALIWAAISRSKKRDDVSMDAKPDASGSKKAKPTETAAAPAAAAAESAEDESSFLSEFTPADLEDLDNQETGEVDPLSEADVYIAYGRFDQAEEMVLQALEAEPGKVPYQHKLLEIYYSNKDAEKFSELAGQMHDAGAEEADPDAWNRAKLMGVELDPENALFADAAEVPSQDVTDDLDMALSELESQLNDDTDASVADLNAPSEDLEELNLEVDTEQAEPELPEFNVPDATPTAEAELEGASEDTIPLPDVDLETTSTSATDEEEAIEELAAELENFDIDDLDASDVGMGEEATLPSEDDLMLPDEDLESFGEMSELDDVSTKLDLARAYIEMGDKEGAKGILEEVLEEGSDAQKQDAKAMISEIS